MIAGLRAYCPAEGAAFLDRSPPPDAEWPSGAILAAILLKEAALARP